MAKNVASLSRSDRRRLKAFVADGNTAQKIVKRVQIILLSAEGHGTSAIMRAVGVSQTTVWRWQKYFIEAGVDGLVKGRSKPPGTKPLSEAVRLAVVGKTM